MYENTSHNKGVGNWYKTTGYNKFQSFTQNAWATPKDLEYLFQSLCNESQLFKDAPIVICFLIMQFIVDCKQVIQLADEPLLTYTNLPPIRYCWDVL